MMPHWEHGYRCHGYWLGEERIGFVGLASGRLSDYYAPYSWYCEVPGKRRSGWVSSLRAAKRAVERAVMDVAEGPDREAAQPARSTIL